MTGTQQRSLKLDKLSRMVNLETARLNVNVCFLLKNVLMSQFSQSLFSARPLCTTIQIGETLSDPPSCLGIWVKTQAVASFLSLPTLFAGVTVPYKTITYKKSTHHTGKDMITIYAEHLLIRYRLANKNKVSNVWRNISI